MPLGRVGSRHLFCRKPREPGCRSPPLPLRHGTPARAAHTFRREVAPQSPREAAQGERRQGAHIERGSAVGHEREKHTRSFVVVGDSSENHLTARSRNGESKHTQFVAKHEFAFIKLCAVEPRDRAHEVLGAKQRTTQAKVGPAALLQTRDNNNVKLQPNGTRGCGDEHCGFCRLRREGVFRHVGVKHGVEKDARGSSRLALDKAAGRGE